MKKSTKRRPGQQPKRDSHQRMVEEDRICHKSKAKNPVKASWEIFNKLKGGKRKDLIDAAIKGGVAYYTARTQYQEWKQAGDRDAKAAAKPLPFVGFTPTVHK